MKISMEVYENIAGQFFKEGHKNYEALPRGLMEEAKEVAEANNDEGVIDELGDVLWYVTVLLKQKGSSLGEAMIANINKLERRALNGKD